VSDGAAQRRAMVERYTSGAILVLHEQRKGRALEGLALYMIDLLDPLGYALAHGMRAHVRGPDPDEVNRKALGSEPALRPIMIGLTTSDALAELSERVAPGLEHVAAHLRAPAPHHHARVLVVAGAGAALAYVPDVEIPSKRGAAS
jgi:hypothetical protein